MRVESREPTVTVVVIMTPKILVLENVEEKIGKWKILEE